MADALKTFFSSSLVRRLAVDPRTGFSLAIHTTCVPQPGDHAVEVIVNGQRIPAGSFKVVAQDPKKSER